MYRRLDAEFVANGLGAAPQGQGQGAPYLSIHPSRSPRIHTKIGTVNIDFGGALFRSTTRLVGGTCMTYMLYHNNDHNDRNRVGIQLGIHAWMVSKVQARSYRNTRIIMIIII